MHGFDSTYNDRLREAWGKFINNEPYDYSFIRPEDLRIMGSFPFLPGGSI